MGSVAQACAQLDRHGDRRALERRDNGVGRGVPIPAGLAPVLREHVRHSTTPANSVCATSTGRPLGHRNVTRELRRAQTAARTPDGLPTYPQL